MGITKIEWTATVNPDGTVSPGRTWSPLRAKVRSDASRIAKEKGYRSLVQIAEKMAGHVGPHCEHVSDGCKNCYSDTNNHRCLPSNGTGLPFDRRSRDLIEPILDEKILLQPLKWKPCRVFVENQSDLFGEWVPDEHIDRVFAVMALCPHITFQILTKRPERMLSWFKSDNDPHRKLRGSFTYSAEDRIKMIANDNHASKWSNSEEWERVIKKTVWPLSNVWLGVSVEDQATAEERTAILRRVPAALRFISQEPQLSEIDWKSGMLDGISWLVQGGESGAGARPFDIEWVMQTRDQCKAAGTTFFLKQLGAFPITAHCGLLFDTLFPDGTKFEHVPGTNHQRARLKDKKGGSMEQWPEGLRIREFPEAR